MRKQSAFMAAVCMAAAILSCACGAQAPAGKKGGAQEQTEVVLWSYYETGEQKKGLDMLIEGFNNSQEEYVARWEYQGPSSEFKKMLSIGVAEENLPDAVLIDNPDMRRYVELGIFEDITAEVTKRFDIAAFYPEVISSVCYDGKYYGMPFCCNNVGLIYNKEMFKAAGMQPPGDWESFRETARALTKEGRYGFAMSAISEEQSAFQLMPWILSTGEDMDDLGGAGTAKALGLIAGLAADGSMPKDCINWSQVDVARQFAAGACAMMENGPWALPLVEEAGIDYGVVGLPVDERGAVVTGGENFGVVKGKNVDGVLALLSYYYEEEVMLRLNSRMYSLPPLRHLAKRQQEENPAFIVFAGQMEHCISRSAYPEWPKLTGTLSQGLYEVLTGGMTPEEAAALIRARAQP